MIIKIFKVKFYFNKNKYKYILKLLFNIKQKILILEKRILI